MFPSTKRGGLLVLNLHYLACQGPFYKNPDQAAQLGAQLDVQTGRGHRLEGHVNLSPNTPGEVIYPTYFHNSSSNTLFSISDIVFVQKSVTFSGHTIISSTSLWLLHTYPYKFWFTLLLSIFLIHFSSDFHSSESCHLFAFPPPPFKYGGYGLAWIRITGILPIWIRNGSGSDLLPRKVKIYIVNFLARLTNMT
jgi:hypothetical protein